MSMTTDRSRSRGAVALAWLLGPGVFAALLAIAACDDSLVVDVGDEASQNPADTVPFDTSYTLLCRDQGTEEPLRAVIRDSVALKELWTETLGTPGTGPRVDFENRVVLVYTTGLQPRSHLAIPWIDEVEIAEDSAVARVYEGSSPGGIARLSRPAHVVQVPRFEGPVEWQVDSTGPEDWPGSLIC